MAFVNEYISEEDMKKYDVREIWKKFRYFSSDEAMDISMGGKYSWTIDKERDVFFIPVRNGKENESNQELCAFWWKGCLLSITIEYLGGDLNKDNKSGSCIWGLVDIWRPENFMVPDADIIPVFKEALTAYKYRGIRSPVNEYIVNFNF